MSSKGTPRKRKGAHGGHHGHHHHAQRDHAANPGADRRDPGGPLMMTRNRTLMTVIAVVLVAGLIAFGIVWALAWG